MHRCLAISTLTAALCLCACGVAPPPEQHAEATADHHFASLQELIGAVVSDDRLVIVPTRNLQVNSSKDGWKLRASAALIVAVADHLGEDLQLSIETTPKQAETLGFRWDSQPLPEPADRRPDGVCTLRLPSQTLEVGTHVLTFYRRDTPGTDDYREDVMISSISTTRGGVTGIVEPSRFHRSTYIADFLALSVTGSKTRERLGGTLFLGPGEASVGLKGGPDGGQLHFRVQNSSPGVAVFTLRCGSSELSTEVGTHGKATLRVPVGAGAQIARLEVTGADGGLYLWGAPQLVTGGDPRPPIVLITLDTTRRDVVPPYPGAESIMPELAAFSAMSTRYERAVSTSPWTLPSHASMFTGLYPSRHRAGVTDQELDPHLTTMAELLQDEGYLTAGIAGGFFSTSRFGLSQGFAIYWNPADNESSAEEVTDRAVEIIDDFSSGPLFLFANYFDVHYPYRAPEAYRQAQEAPELAQQVPSSSPWRKILRGNAGTFDKAATGKLQPTAAALAALRSEYRAEAAYMDAEIGRLFAELRAADLFDRAMIVVVSDHGELLGERGFFGHSCRLDPELIHVPMMVKMPQQRTAKVVRSVVSVADLFPTVLHAAGIPAPASDGVLLGTEEHAGEVSQRRVFSEEHAMGIHKLIDGMRVSDRLFAIDGPDRRRVVWDFGQECFEIVNGQWSSTECAQEVAAAMEGIIRELDPPSPLHQAGTHDLSEEETEALRSLGYLR